MKKTITSVYGWHLAYLREPKIVISLVESLSADEAAELSEALSEKYYEQDRELIEALDEHARFGRNGKGAEK